MDLGSNEWMGFAALCVVGYLSGSIPFGLLIGKWRGVDIRTQGSGNIGATNAGRVLGRPIGFLVFFLDLLKGFAPTFAAGFLVPAASIESVPPTTYVLWVLVAATCILGHIFPIYLKFKGGKGVATALGVLLGVYPFFTIPVLFAFGLWIVVTAITRYVSVGSVAAAIAFPIIFAITVHLNRKHWGEVQNLWPLYLFGIVVGGLVIYRHRGNLRRLQEGAEPRIGSPRVLSRPG